MDDVPAWVQLLVTLGIYAAWAKVRTRRSTSASRACEHSRRDSGGAPDPESSGRRPHFGVTASR